jgi:hypothetical protein
LEKGKGSKPYGIGALAYKKRNIGDKGVDLGKERRR